MAGALVGRAVPAIHDGDDLIAVAARALGQDLVAMLEADVARPTHIGGVAVQHVAPLDEVVGRVDEGVVDAPLEGVDKALVVGEDVGAAVLAAGRGRGHVWNWWVLQLSPQLRARLTTAPESSAV